MAQTFGDILKGRTAETFDDILKFNPYHGKDGRFTTAGSATSFTYAPGKSKAHDLAITREKARTAAMAVSPEEKVKQTLKTVEDKIRKQDYESAACIDKNGNQIFFKDGAAKEVEFSREESGQMKGNILTHNHPDSSCFSREDVHTFVVTEMSEIRVACKNGINYSLKRIGEQNYQQEYKFIDAFAKQVIKHKQAELKVDRENDIPGKIRRGEISVQDANRSINSRIGAKVNNYLSKHAKKYGFEFSVEGAE